MYRVIQYLEKERKSLEEKAESAFQDAKNPKHNAVKEHLIACARLYQYEADDFIKAVKILKSNVAP